MSSTRKLDLVRSLGADHVLDYKGGRWTGGFGRTLRAAALSLFVRQRLAMLVVKEHFSTLERLAQLMESGEVTPSIDRAYPLERVPEAMRQLETGNVRGRSPSPC